MLQSTGVSSNRSSLSSSNSYLSSILEKAEGALEYEEIRLAEYNKKAKTLEYKVKHLTKEFLVSEAKFIESKVFLLNSKLNLHNESREIKGLLTMVKYSEKESSSFYALIKKFHYKNLSDEMVEILLPIWKADKYQYASRINTIISFISASVESKMKSDLLNSAGNKLHMIINCIENQKINVIQIMDKIRKIKTKFNSFTKDDLDSQDSQDEKDNSYIKNDIWLRSDDLYGLDIEYGDTSTIIFQDPEPNCTNCLCVTF